MVEEGKKITTQEYGQSILEYYLQEMTKDRLPEMKAILTSRIPEVDSDYIQTVVDSSIDRMLKDVATKANYVLLLLVELACTGRLDDVEEFETLLLDLVERRILSLLEKEKQNKLRGYLGG